jgi:release factor glutamine methyltransferase
VPADSIREALSEGLRRVHAADAPKLTAEVLLAEVLGCDRAHLFSHPEQRLSAAQSARYGELLERRAGGEPLHYITGEREFFGLTFEVTPAVLIPRPETEHLVEQVLERVGSGRRIVDVGVGSGAIAVSLAKHLDNAQVTGVDLSADALKVARRNARRHGVDVQLVQADLLAGFPEGAFDAVVSNPPYVAESARDSLQPEIAWEPPAALFAGDDGLAVYRRLIPQAERLLQPGGLLSLELGHDSLPAVKAMLKAGSWKEIDVAQDLAGIARVVSAEKRPD